MHERLLADLRGGKKAALARAISIVENHRAFVRFLELRNAVSIATGGGRPRRGR